MAGEKWREVEYYPDERRQKAIIKDFKFEDFAQALDFVNKVGELAEKANHHPDISFGWGYARVWLTSHSEKAVTKKDRELAKAIDALR